MRSAGAVRVLALVVTGLLLATLVGCADPDAPDRANDLIGSGAPGLSGENLTGEGTLDLASMKGKPTVVTFWLPACPHCREMIPALQRAWLEAAPDANILTVGLDRNDPTVPTVEGYETPQAFVETTGLTLPTVRSGLTLQSETWSLAGVPTTFVLDADHVVKQVFYGPTDPARILDAIGA